MGNTKYTHITYRLHNQEHIETQLQNAKSSGNLKGVGLHLFNIERDPLVDSDADCSTRSLPKTDRRCAARVRIYDRLSQSQRFWVVFSPFLL